MRWFELFEALDDFDIEEREDDSGSTRYYIARGQGKNGKQQVLGIGIYHRVDDDLATVHGSIGPFHQRKGLSREFWQRVQKRASDENRTIKKPRVITDDGERAWKGRNFFRGVTENYLVEAEIPPTRYGYWITDEGKIHPVGYQDHNGVARQYGFDSQHDARRAGWIAIVMGRGEFGADIGRRMTKKAISSLRRLVGVAEENGCWKYFLDNEKFDTAAATLRSITNIARAQTIVGKETDARRAAGWIPYDEDFPDGLIPPPTP